MSEPIPEAKRALAVAGLTARIDANRKRALEVVQLMGTIDDYDALNALVATQRSPWDRWHSQLAKKPEA